MCPGGKRVYVQYISTSSRSDADGDDETGGPGPAHLCTHMHARTCDSAQAPAPTHPRGPRAAHALPSVLSRISLGRSRLPSRLPTGRAREHCRHRRQGAGSSPLQALCVKPLGMNSTGLSNPRPRQMPLPPALRQPPRALCAPPSQEPG